MNPDPCRFRANELSRRLSHVTTGCGGVMGNAAWAGTYGHAACEYHAFGVFAQRIIGQELVVISRNQLHAFTTEIALHNHRMSGPVCREIGIECLQNHSMGETGRDRF